MYTVDPGCGKAFDVWCDLQGGGWTARTVSFNRSWDDYVDGFGDLKREHWLGLEKIHCLTASKGAELYIDMYDCDGVGKYARYSYFHVEGNSVNYKLHFSGYSGTAGDSFTAIVNLNGMQFTTRDHDNDQWSSGHCSQHWEANRWWFNNCFRCNLNGPYLCGPVERDWVGVIWETFRGGSQSLKYTEMKMY